MLLTYPEERVLSSLHQTEETTAFFGAAALEVPLADMMKLLTSLNDKGLVRETGQSRRGVHYSLTEAERPRSISFRCEEGSASSLGRQV